MLKASIAVVLFSVAGAFVLAYGTGQIGEREPVTFNEFDDGGAVVSAEDRYDLTRDLRPDHRLTLGSPDAPWASLYLNGSLDHAQNLSFHGSEGITLLIGKDGTVSLPGRLQTTNVTATHATYPHEEPPAGISCWDTNRDSEANDEEDTNKDGVVDVWDCGGKEGQEGRQGARGIVVKKVGDEGPPGIEGTPGASAHPLLFQETELPIPGPCVNGGRIIRMGLDDGIPGGVAFDRRLQLEERDKRILLCYGAGGGVGDKGQTGDRGQAGRAMAWLRQSDDEDACGGLGGFNVTIGWDDGRGGATAGDGNLTGEEPLGAHRICRGATGEPGMDGDPAERDGTNGTDAVPPQLWRFVKQGISPPNDVGDPGENGAYILRLRTLDTSTGCFTYSFGADDGTGLGTARDGVLDKDEMDKNLTLCRGPEGEEGRDGKKWNHTQPDPAVASKLIFNMPDTAMAATLDPEGRLAIAYGLSTGGIGLLRCDDIECGASRHVVLDPNNTDDPGQDIAIAMRAAGAPVVAYTDLLGQLWIIDCTNELCDGDAPTLVASSVRTARQSMDMVIASDGCPTLAYARADKLWSAHPDPTKDCTLYSARAIVANPAGQLPTGYGVQMVNQWDGLPALVYYDDQQGEVRHASCPDAACTPPLQYSSAISTRGQPVSMALNKQGSPMILVEAEGPNNLYFYACADPRCTPSGIVEKALHVGKGFEDDASLSFGADGMPLIALRDASGLTFIKCHNETCKDAHALTMGDGGNRAQLVMGYHGLPLLLHGDGDGDLALVQLGSPHGPSYWHRRG